MAELANLLVGSMAEWTAGLPRYQQRLMAELSVQGVKPEHLARVWLEAGSNVETAPFGGQSGARIFYSKFLDELHDFLCAAERYQSERAELISALNNGKPGAVALTATVLTNALPASTAHLQPVVAVAMFAVATMGLNAWCKMQTERRAKEQPSPQVGVQPPE